MHTYRCAGDVLGYRGGCGVGIGDNGQHPLPTWGSDGNECLLRLALPIERYRPRLHRTGALPPDQGGPGGFAVDFGLLRGSVVKEFASFHLPERSFLYLLHAMRDENPSPSRLISSPEWRLFLMRPADVEHELLRLHQFKKLEYQVAGSLVQLSLPCANTREYAERMVA